MPQHPDFPQPQTNDEQRTTTKRAARPSPLADLTARSRRMWEQAWTDGGVLHGLWQDIRTAPRRGADMAHWLKALLILAGLSVVVLLAEAAGSAIGHAVGDLLAAAPTVDIGTDTSSGVWTVIDNPIRIYLAQHSVGMAVSGSTLYTLWQVGGLYGLIGGFTGSTIARLVWTAWGAASAAAIWVTVPSVNRTLAVAVAVLAWGLASLFALRGLRLLPSVRIVNNPTIKP
ncbi:hypothetical protein [Streptomyces sp. NPDC006552]|uniref:hypothetical protein n=1 Tax=Streptomyces sp. NPDC006552 TaxID=3157179 RepID=UPI0033A9F37D